MHFTLYQWISQLRPSYSIPNKTYLRKNGICLLHLLRWHTNLVSIFQMCPTWNTWPWTKSRNPAVLGIIPTNYILITLAYWWQSSFEFLHLILVKCNNILDEYTDSIFKVNELVWVGAKVIQSKNFCQLYMKIYSIGQSQLVSRKGWGGQERPANEKSHPTLPTIHSCNWPKYLRPSYVTDKRYSGSVHHPHKPIQSPWRWKQYNPPNC